jgi:hypothetical protein
MPFSHPVEALEAANYLIPELTAVSVEVNPEVSPAGNVDALAGDQRLALRFTPMEIRG